MEVSGVLFWMADNVETWRPLALLVLFGWIVLCLYCMQDFWDRFDK